MIHRMDPPADPEREPMPAHLVPMLAKLGTLPATRTRLRLRDQVGRHQGARLLRARAFPDREPQPERHHRAVPGAAPPRPSARLARRDPRRRDRRLRRAGPAELRAAPAPHAPDPRRGHQAARAGDPGALPAVRRALPGGAHGHGTHIRRAPRAARVASASRARTGGRRRYHRGEGKALVEASATNGLEGVVAKRLDSTYSPGRRSPVLDQGQEQAARAAGGRRLAAREGARGPARRAAGGLLRPRRATSATRGAWAPASTPRSARGSSACSRRSSASARRSRASAAPAARATSSPRSWLRSSSRSGPTTGCCAIPPTRARSTRSRTRSCWTRRARTSQSPSRKP